MRPGRRAKTRLTAPRNNWLFRRLQYDPVAAVYPIDRAVVSQPFKRSIDGVAQCIIRADHADGDVPVEIGYGLVAVQDTKCLVRMRQIEITRRSGCDRSGIDLMV